MRDIIETIRRNETRVYCGTGLRSTLEVLPSFSSGCLSRGSESASCMSSRWRSRSVGPSSVVSLIILGFKARAPLGTNVEAMMMADKTVNYKRYQ